MFGSEIDLGSPVTLHWIKHYKCKSKAFWGGKTKSRGDNWNTAVFSVLGAENFKNLRGILLNSWNGYQKIYIKINWLSGNVQTGIFVAEHEGWIKMNEHLLNRQLIVCII